MGDLVAAQRAVNFLSQFRLFGQNVTIRPSNNPSINSVRNPSDRDDGSPSLKEYWESKANRFLTVKSASKNRLPMASSNVYWFNAPFGIEEQFILM